MKIFAIITGVLTAILGCFAIAMPLRVFLGIGWLLGALVLANGISGTINAFCKKQDENKKIPVRGFFSPFFH